MTVHLLPRRPEVVEAPQVGDVIQRAHQYRPLVDRLVHDFAKAEPDFVDPETGVQMDQYLQGLYSQGTGRIFVVRHSSSAEGALRREHKDYYVAELALGADIPAINRRNIL